MHSSHTPLRFKADIYEGGVRGEGLAGNNLFISRKLILCIILLVGFFFGVGVVVVDPNLFNLQGFYFFSATLSDALFQVT